MKTKIIGFGILLTLVVGLFLIDSPSKRIMEPGSPSDTAESDEFRDQSDGTVFANDEPPDSQAFQHSADIPPQPTYAARKPSVKKPEKLVIINNKEYPLRTYKPALVPNDPQASGWWVGNAKLNQAWDTPSGGIETVLAIIDTGFGLEHEEFSNRWYINSTESGSALTEQPSDLNCSDRGLAISASCNLIDDDRDSIVDNETGPASYENPSRLNCTTQAKPLTRDCNRVDDDGNGYVDDLRGWDFINNDNSVQAGELNASGTGTRHGTMVAGVAAATGNNGRGLAGIDWNTKILPIQALDDDSYGDTLSVGQAILYAASRGADVINLSLGSDLSDDYVEEAIQTAIALGSVVVAASGNDSCNCIIYPANYPEVIAVGALDSTNNPAWFSSWGTNLDILAPGVNINSATWTSSNGVSAYTSGINGTSFAAPMVAGTLTRLLSQQPAAKPLQLISALTENTNRLSLTLNVPVSPTLGSGALDSAKATIRMATPNNSSILYLFNPVSAGNQLAAGQSAEIPGALTAHTCSDGVVGSTPIYELIKNGSHFFSISSSEASQAARIGYSRNIFARACLQQPHDTLSNFRSLNLFSEFRNIYRPL